MWLSSLTLLILYLTTVRLSITIFRFILTLVSFCIIAQFLS
nr:MAG TPA: hypothetical protein [Caudoviricetes sp.]